MNNSNCTVFYPRALIILSSSNTISLIACLVALTLVWHFKLYKRTVYRLALYQVLAALELAAVLIAQIQFLNYDPSHHGTMCIATAFFFLQSQWTKLLLAVWVTIHLFCFAVFHKNLQKFEFLYVLSSLLLPLAIATVPLATGTYGMVGSWCWIQDVNDDCIAPNGHDGFVQQLVLWTTPSIVILLMMSVAMVVMVIILARRSCPCGPKNDSVTGKHQNRKALKQLLPLAAYPMLFCVFGALPLANRIFEKLDYDQLQRVFEVGAALSTAVWSLSPSVAKWGTADTVTLFRILPDGADEFEF